MINKRLKTVADFLNGIGLRAEFVEDFTAFKAALNFKPFLNDVVIKNGTLYYHAPSSVSALLHEAGHLAVLHPAYRPLVNGSLSPTLEQMCEEIDCLQPENKKYCYAEDVCATAWAWAAGKHLNIPERLIILSAEYANGGDDIRTWLRSSYYIGITQLQHAGFCASNERLHRSLYPHLPVYPTLGKWLQD